MAAVGGLSGAFGSFAGPYFDKGWDAVNGGSIAGAGAFGLFGGAFQGMYAGYVGYGTLGTEVVSNFVGGIPAMIGDLAGGYAWNNYQAQPGGNFTDWNPTMSRTDWLRATGCKP
jgi:hypothetical protein